MEAILREVVKETRLYWGWHLPRPRTASMKLTNTSRYSDPEVRLLVAFGMQDIDHSRLAVHVRNSSRAYRGRAYEGIPHLSARTHDEDVDRLVTIGIGAPKLFPCTNLQTSVRWVKVKRDEDTSAAVLRRRRDRLGRVQTERQVVEQHGYGGKRSPVLTFHNWREALVSVAAHEARHIWQYQFDQPRSEVDAEQRAGERIEAFRLLNTPRRLEGLQLRLSLD